MKLVGYNIQYSRGRDGCYDLARVACAVDGADIIALQEVERFWPRTGMADQPAELAAVLPGYYWVYGPGFDMDASTVRGGVVENRRRQFGNMLLARWPIVSSRFYALPKMRTTDHFNMDMPALEGVIATESGPLRVWSIHLSSISSRERLLQIDYLRDLHARVPAGGGAWTGAPDIRGDESWSCGAPEPPMPADAIWIGDFNAQPTSAEYDAIVGRADPLYGRPVYHGDFVDAWVAAAMPRRKASPTRTTGGLATCGSITVSSARRSRNESGARGSTATPTARTTSRCGPSSSHRPPLEAQFASESSTTNVC